MFQRHTARAPFVVLAEMLAGGGFAQPAVALVVEHADAQRHVVIERQVEQGVAVTAAVLAVA
jgi:hypothetical protein